MKISFSSVLKDYAKSTYKYFFAFVFLFVYLEIALRLVISHSLCGENLFFLAFVPSFAFFFSFFCGFHSKNALINKIVFCFLSFLITLYFLVQLVYFRVFGSLFSISLVKMGGEATGNFLDATFLYIKKSFLQIVLFLLPFVIFVVFACLDKKVFSKKICFRFASLVLCVLFWFVALAFLRCFGNERGSAYYTYKNSFSDTDSSAEKFGTFTTALLETKSYIFKNSASSKLHSTDSAPKNAESEGENGGFNSASNLASEPNEPLSKYFASKPIHQKNEYTGLCKDFNVVYICAESFSTIALNEKITPLLCKMANNGIVLSNYYNSYRNVTTNGEFAFATSIWPDVSRSAGNGDDVGSFSRTSKNAMPYGLGTLFSNNGYRTFAYHNYIGSYYNRKESWKNLGFETMKFRGEGLSFENVWCPSDLELVQQVANDLLVIAGDSDSQNGISKFLMYWMTFSGHGPYTTETYLYKKYNEVVREKLSDGGEKSTEYSDTEISYLCANYDLELALQYLCEHLAEKNQLEKTIFVLTGDHIPYMLSSDEQCHMAELAGLKYDPIWQAYHSTAILYSPSIKNPIQSKEFCCNVDLLPTVLNLLDFDVDFRLFFGIDILDNSSDVVHRARFYNGNFITDRLMYRQSNATAIWYADGKNMSDEEKSEYLNKMIEFTENEYEKSIAVVETDFFRRK